MARTLTPVDVYAIVNQMFGQLTGETSQSVIDTSSFISAGSKILTYPTENVLNALTMVLSKTIVASRPYSSPLKLLRSENSGMYSNRTRKISFYSQSALPSGDFNTQLYTNLKDGFDNGKNNNTSTASQWEQHNPVPLEFHLGGSSVWQHGITTYKYQLKSAFENEGAFASFVSGYLNEHASDIEQMKESYDRLVLCNAIAGAVSMNSTGSVVNLTTAFNTAYGTTYTSEELRTTYKTEFLKFFVSTFKQTARHMAYRSVNYHWSPAKQIDGVDYYLLRHTSNDNLRALMYSPFFVDAEATVMSEVFHPEYLDIKNYQPVDFWQTFNSPAINIKPVVVNKSTMVQEAASDAVSIPYVLGILYDKDFMMTDYILDDTETTPIEARKKYYNTWLSVVRNGIVDYTENHVVFIMKDE